MPNKLKAWLPVWTKKIPWYLFKSPQRKTGFWFSIKVEIYGISSWLIHIVLRRKSLQPISICTGIKGRATNYLTYVLPSIIAMEHQELIEISIFDCGAEDTQRLEDEIRKQWKGKLVFITNEQPFARSLAFNKAIAQATHPLIFTADADLTLPQNLPSLCNKYVSKHTVWFPICFDLKEGKPAIATKENGKWLIVGKGMFAASKEQFYKAGAYDEKYKQWGDEDWDLWFRFFKAKTLPIRTRCRGLFHHYHPSLRPDDYKPGF